MSGSTGAVPTSGVSADPLAAPGRRAPGVVVAVGAAGLSVAAALATLRTLSFVPEAFPVLLLGAAVAMALLRKPVLALPVFVALTWTGIDGGDVAGLPSPVEVAALALLAAAVWYALAHRALTRDVALLLLLLGLPIAAAAVASPQGIVPPIDAMKELVFLLIVAVCVRTTKDVDRAVIALVPIGIFLSLGAVYSVLVHPTGLFPLHEVRPGVISPEAPRAAGPFGEANFFAMSLAALVPMAMYLFARKGPLRWLGMAAGISLAAGLMATGSRGGLIAGVTAAVLFGAMSGVRKLQVATVALVLVGAALLPLFGEQASGASERSVKGRKSENQVALLMFNDHPVTGVGPGQYRSLYRDFARRVGTDRRPLRDPHSLPLQIAAEQGIAGLIGWLGAAVVAIAFVMRTRIWTTLLGRALVASTFAYLVASLFLHGSRLRLLFILVGLLIALGSALSSSSARESRFSA